MNSEQTAITLEIFSFFFVTLDLYGKKRLTKLQKFVDGSANRIKNTGIFKGIVEKNVFAITIFILCNLILGGLMIKTWFFLLDAEDSHEYIPLLIIISIVLIVIWIGMVASLSRTIISIFKALEWSIDKLILLFLRILQIFKIEGVLLFIGSMLFLISKCISLSNI